MHILKTLTANKHNPKPTTHII